MLFVCVLSVIVATEPLKSAVKPQIIGGVL